MNPSEHDSLRALIGAATPFIRIKGADRHDWCRVMEDPDDGRIGPWSYVADYDTLDPGTWKRAGEVVYFVTDSGGALRLVGQSKSKLSWRWKAVPMFDVQSRRPLGRKALFHTTSWPAIEDGIRKADPPPFTVSALFRDKLETICRASSSSLRNVLAKPETSLHRLSYHVESWICGLDFGARPLWNRQKVAGG